MYLAVKFYDNDFGAPMFAALERLWGYIKDNNAAYAFDGRCHLTVCRIFEKLLACDALQPMLLRLFILESLCREVESKTRGLHHWDKWTEDDVQIANPSHLEPDSYLRCKVEIYKQFEIIPDIEWANSECAFLNLETGVVGTY